MSEWWTYTISDLLLFSADTYHRLYERYNEAIWPWQLLPLTAGLAIALIPRTKTARAGRWAAALLAASWLWVAWGYHLQRYAAINWVAPVFAALFLLEAVLLFWTGMVRTRLAFKTPASIPDRAGWGVYGFALAVQPLLTPLVGRPWTQAGLFGTAPDPTAIATLGILLLSGNGPHWGLLIIPMIWCAVSGATLYGLGSPLAGIMFLVPTIVLVCAVWKSRPKSRVPS